MIKSEDQELVEIAKCVFLEGKTQTEIAKKLNVSGTIISRKIKKIKEKGIFEFYVRDETVRTVRLEKSLEKRFGLIEAVVISTFDKSYATIRSDVAQAAVSYVSENIKKISKLGIAWGLALTDFVKEFPYDENSHLKIIPLIGGMGIRNIQMHSNQLVHKLSEKMSCDYSYLYAPAMVNNKIKKQLMEIDDFDDALEEARNVDMAVFGIGALKSRSTLTDLGYLNLDTLKKLEESNAVGDLNCNFFDINGLKVSFPEDKSPMGLDLEEIKKIDKVVGIVPEVDKTESVKGILNGGYLNVLITNEVIARRLLEE